MNKKILIGSILAVALLTLVSLSNVVGYQSVKSDTKTNSPLFSIRNNKGDIDSNYLGKGNAINILLPKRDSEADLFDKFIDTIKVMDDRLFDKFVNRFIAYFNQNKVDDVEVSNEEIEDMLFQIRSNPDAMKNSYIYLGKEIPTAWTHPICFAFLLILAILLYPFIIIYIILVKLGIFP